jgi:hypothetical protein
VGQRSFALVGEGGGTIAIGPRKVPGGNHSIIGTDP